MNDHPGRAAVVAACARRGIDSGFFATACVTIGCGAFVEAHALPFCYRCIIKRAVEAAT